MRVGFSVWCFAVIVAVLLSVSSISAGDVGSQKTVEIEKSAERYKAQLEKSPDKAELWRKLGISYFQLERFDEALTALTKASMLDPKDALSVVYRGMIHEQKGQLDQAKNLYQSYLAFGKQDRLTQEVRYRFRWIEDNELQKVVDQAVRNEKNVKIAEIPKNSVAIIRFNVDSLSPQLKPLGRGLAELVYTDLSYVPDLKLVERLELTRLQDELKLSQSEYSDKFSAPRIGKIVGAAKIITGQVKQVDGERIGIDCGIIDVGPGLAEYPGRQEGKLAEAFAMQKKLTLSIIQKLGYEITPTIKNQIDKSPTESFLALLAFSRGLDYADQGLYPLAEADFTTALAEDPHFELAKQQLDRYSGLSNYSGTLKPLSQITGLVTQESTTEDMKENNRGEIIQRLQDATNGVIPEEDTPYVAPKASRGKVVVTGRTDH
ncbi:MAG: tetratricopeptide repeat protein [Candidatus Zixiibacteriota bacterium]|nr:MAG: tetratricopeptide repeat protein [candidate division Zixibacteria bacterium]